MIMVNRPSAAIRVGLWALPLYGALTAWATLDAQPDQVTDPEGWARFVSTNYYLLSHLVGSTGGTILAILGTMALGGYLASGRSAKLGVPAMAVAVAGHALLLVPAAISTFALPAIGRTYLGGPPTSCRSASRRQWRPCSCLDCCSRWSGTSFSEWPCGAPACCRGGWAPSGQSQRLCFTSLASCSAWLPPVRAYQLRLWAPC